MNPVRKKRLYIILAILAGVGVAVALALSALQQNINLFYTPTQIANGEAPRTPASAPAAWWRRARCSVAVIPWTCSSW